MHRGEHQAQLQPTEPHEPRRHGGRHGLLTVAVVVASLIGLLNQSAGALPPDGPPIIKKLQDKADGVTPPPRQVFTPTAPNLRPLPRCVNGSSTGDGMPCNSDGDAGLAVSLGGHTGTLAIGNTTRFNYPFLLLAGRLRCVRVKVSGFDTSTETDAPVVRTTRQCEGNNVGVLADLMLMSVATPPATGAIVVELSTLDAGCSALIFCTDADVTAAMDRVVSSPTAVTTLHFRA